MYTLQSDILTKELAEGSTSSVEEALLAKQAEGSFSSKIDVRELVRELADSRTCVGNAHQLSLKFAEQTSKDDFYLLHDMHEFSTLERRNGCGRINPTYFRERYISSYDHPRSPPSIPTVTSLEFAGKKGAGLPERSTCISEKTLRMCYFKEEVRARNFPNYHGINYLSTIKSLAPWHYRDCRFLDAFRRDFEAFIKVNEVKPETFKIHYEGEGDEPFQWIIPKEK
jgi:hypothetical protein